jgi:hypothetical protein
MKLYKEGRRAAASLGAPVACRMSEDHRNIFILFRLYSGMRFLLGFLVLMTAQAMSLKDFNARPAADRSAYVADFIDKMTTDVRAKNPELAQVVKQKFPPPSK